MKNLKKKVIKFLAQKLANMLVRQMQENLDNKEVFYMFYERACQLNAYCVVFHDIYLD